MEASRTKIQKTVDWIFGYDFFISYSWEDGRKYAEELARQLTTRDFTCFLDSNNYAKGDNWKEVGARTLRHTGCLILVGTTESLKSDAVERELRIFTKNKHRIIPININNSLSNIADSKLKKYLPDELLRIEECQNTNGIPSSYVITEIESSFDLIKQNHKRLRIATALAFIFFCLALSAALLSYFTYQTNIQLYQQQVENHGSLLFLQAEKLANNKHPNLQLSNLLAIESHNRSGNLDALNLLRSNLIYQGRYQEGFTIPWNLGNTDKIEYANNMEIFAHYSYRGDLVIYRTLDGTPLKKISGFHRIRYVAISPSGKYLAVSHRSQDKKKLLSVYKLNLSSAKTQPQRLYSKPFDPPINGGNTRYRPVVFSDDGERIALAPKLPDARREKLSVIKEKTNRIELYHSSSGELITTIKTRVDTKLISIYNDTLFYSGSTLTDRKKVLRAYNLVRNKVTSGFSYPKMIYDFSISNNKENQLAIAVGNTLYLKRWNKNEKKLESIKKIKYRSSIFAVNYSHDSRRFLVTSYPNNIDVRSSENFKRIFETNTTWPVGNTGFVDFNKIITVRRYGGPLTFEFWEKGNNFSSTLYFNKPISKPVINTIRNLSSSKSSKKLLRLIDNGEKREANIYSLGPEPKLIERYEINGLAAAISLDGQYLALDEGNGHVKILDLFKNHEVKKVKYTRRNHELLSFLAFDSQSQRLITATHEASQLSINEDNFYPTVDDSIKAWSLGSQNEPIKFDAGIAVGYALSSDGDRLLTVTNFSLEMWNLENGEEQFSIQLPRKSVIGGDRFSEPYFINETDLFSVITSRDGDGQLLELRSTTSGDVKAKFSFDADLTAQLNIPELNLLALGSSNGEILFIDLKTLKRTKKLINHGNSIKDLDYSDSLNLLVTLTNDEQNQIKAWHLDNQGSIKEMTRISQAGAKNILINDENQSVHVVGEYSTNSWPLQNDYWMSIAQSRLKENIALDDWLNYFPRMPYEKTLLKQSMGQISGNITTNQFSLLLENYSVANDQSFFRRLLYWAVTNRRADLIPLLASKGSDLKTFDTSISPSSKTALIKSIDLGFDDMVSSLINSGVSWTSEENNNQSPLWLALSIHRKFPEISMLEIISLLIDKGAHKQLLVQRDFMDSGEYTILNDILTNRNNN